MPNEKSQFTVLKELAKILGLAAAYFITGKLGTMLAIPPGYATPIWAPSGFALAGVLLFGYRVWPGILLGSFLVNIGTSSQALSSASNLIPLLATTGVGLGASLQAVFGAFLIRRFVGFPNPLDREKDVLLFLLLGGPASCVTNATIAVSTLSMAGAIPWSDYLVNWETWWIGDAIGVIVLTPLILAAVTSREKGWSGKRISVVLPLCLTFVLVILLFIAASKREQAQTKLAFERKAKAMSLALQTRLKQDLVLLQNTESLFEAAPDLDRSVFHQFVRNWLNPLTGVEAVIWAVRIRPGDLEKTIRNSDAPDFNISGLEGRKVRTPRLEESIVPTYVEPLEEYKHAIGFDLSSNPLTEKALIKARDSGNSQALLPLAIPGTTPVDSPLALILPAYTSRLPHGNVQDRRTRLKGFVIGLLSVPIITEFSLSGLDREGIDLAIVDETVPSQSQILYRSWANRSDTIKSFSNIPNPRLGVGVECSAPLEIAGRRWILRFSEPEEYLLAHPDWHAWAVLLGGLLFTSLLGAFLLVVAGRTSRIERSERERIDEMKTDFVSFASHQLRTPVAEIKGLIENLLRGLAGDLTEHQKKYANHILEISTRNLRLITDLLNVSKIKAGTISTDIKPVPLRQIVDATVENYSWIIEKKGLNLHVEEFDPDLIVNADFQKMVEALRNVLENSLRFTTNGSITLALRAEPDFGILELSDTGVGMAPELLAKIFSKELILSSQPAGKNQGTGLGLYITKSFLLLQHGDVSVTSVLGKGSKFTFRLPRARA